MVSVLDVLAIFTTPFGIAAFLIGILLFFGIPILAAITPFKWPSKMMFALATAPLSRAAVVISESNDAVFKTMSFTEPGVETIQLGDEEKIFGDPDAALHWWRGVRFALAMEPDGILFDPRHAAIGKQKARYDKREEAEYRGTEPEWDSWGITSWKPAVFELPNNPVLQNLSYVRELVDGGERAEYPQRVESFYRHSQDPFSDGGAASKFLYPILGFAIPFFGIWILASQLGTPGSGPTSSVSFGSLGLLAALFPSEIKYQRIKQIITRVVWLIFGLALFVGIPTGIFYALWVYVAPLFAIGIAVAFFTGFGLLPFFSVLVRFSTRLTGAFAQLFAKLGFLGYREPVFMWTPEKYTLVEAGDLPGNVTVDTWYGLFGSKVGFCYDPDADVWDDSETMPAEQVAEHGADHDIGSTNLPTKYQPAPSIKRDGIGGFVPNRVTDNATYLRSAVSMARFRNSADGQNSMERLLLAKEKWGGMNNLIPNKTVLYLTFATTLVGGFLGVFFFVA